MDGQGQEKGIIQNDLSTLEPFPTTQEQTTTKTRKQQKQKQKQQEEQQRREEKMIKKLVLIFVASTLLVGHACGQTVKQNSTWEQAAKDAFDDFISFREGVLGSLDDNPQLDIGYVAATVKPGEILKMKFQVYDMENVLFTNDEISFITGELFQSGIGNLTHHSRSPDNPGALDFVMMMNDDGGYGEAIDNFRTDVSSVLDINPEQIGQVALTVENTSLSMQFQILPPEVDEDAANCTFSQSEVERIQNVLKNGGFDSIGTVSQVLYDCGGCGHVGATLTVSTADDSGYDTGDDDDNTDTESNLNKNYVYSYSEVTRAELNNRMTGRKLQTGETCEFNIDCESLSCSNTGSCW